LLVHGVEGFGYAPRVTDGDADLTDLERLCTLSPVVLAAWAEAAAVMLSKFV